jgi:hypothetical protein
MSTHPRLFGPGQEDPVPDADWTREGLIQGTTTSELSGSMSKVTEWKVSPHRLHQYGAEAALFAS